MVRVVHTAISGFESMFDEVQSPDQSENNINDINVLEFYHVIRWNLTRFSGKISSYCYC